MEINSTLSEAFTNSTTPVTPLQVDSLEICMLCISLLIGLPTQACLLSLIVTKTKKGDALVDFNLSLSVCEINTCLNTLLFVLSKWSSTLLVLSLFLQGFVLIGRPLFQCLISVERYLAVVHPVTFLKYKPLRYRVICCSVAWIIVLSSCLCCLLVLMFSSVYAHVWFFSLQFLLFFSIQLFCLVAVLRALKQTGPGERKRDKEENQIKRRAFFLILLSTANMVFVYVPFSVIAFFNILMQHNFLAFWIIALICYFLASFMQFLVYLHRAEKLSCFY